MLVKTSNPGGKTFQDLNAGDGLHPSIATWAIWSNDWPKQTTGRKGYGIVGAVVGATYPEQAAELRAAMPHTWFLVPGYGSQGATARDVAGAFDATRPGRGRQQRPGHHLRPARREYAEQFGAARWQDAVAAATRDMIAQLAADTPAGKLA